MESSAVALLLCWATASVAQLAAMDLTLVSYVIALKRTSAIMSVVWDAWLFKEKGLRERLGGQHRCFGRSADQFGINLATTWG